MSSRSACFDFWYCSRVSLPSRRRRESADITSERQMTDTPREDAEYKIESTRSLPDSFTYRLASAEESRKTFKASTAFLATQPGLEWPLLSPSAARGVSTPADCGANRQERSWRSPCHGEGLECFRRFRRDQELLKRYFGIQ